MQREIKQTLQEARKAYRFLYNYQKRILDLVSYIGQKYNFKFKGGYPHFSNMQRKSTSVELDLWAWDWLNMYYYEFLFEAKEEQEDIIHFSIFIVNDTGYFDLKDKSHNDRIDTDKFKSVELSESKIILVSAKNVWDCNEWGYNWNDSQFISRSEGKEDLGNEKIMLFKSYNLERFQNEISAMKCIDNFSDYCKENSIFLDVYKGINQ